MAYVLSRTYTTPTHTPTRKIYEKYAAPTVPYFHLYKHDHLEEKLTCIMVKSMHAL